MTSSPISLPNSSVGGPKSLGLPDIALFGKAGAGKSTASAGLMELLDYARFGFTKPLKDLATRLWGPDAAKDRGLRLKLGAALREIDSDVLVNLLLLRRQLSGRVALNNSTSYISKNDAMPLPRSWDRRKPHVVDDCRYENEWWALKGEGFVIVRLIAPRNARIDRLKANGKWQGEAQLDDPIEIAVDHLKSDYYIVNDADKDALHDALINIVIKERKRR